MRILFAVLAIAGVCLGQTPQTTAVTVTASATPTFTANSGNTIFRYTLAQNVTSSTFSAAAPGTYIFRICQPSSGGPFTFAAFTGSVGMATVPTAASACLDQGASWDGTILRFLPATTGAGIVTLTSGSGAPVAACTAPSSGNWATYVDTSVSPPDMWDCVATNTWVRRITSDGIGLVQVNGPLATNAGTTGTTQNKLAKINSSGNAVIAATTDTAIPLYLVVAGAGTSGQAKLAVAGQALCVVDAAGVTVGHFVQVSTTVAGACHDAGATAPTSGWVLGVALATATSGNTFAMALANGYNAAAGGGSGLWGTIGGTLSAQTDLNTALGLKAPALNAVFTGTFTVPAAVITPANMKASTVDVQTDGTTVTWAIASVKDAQAKLTFTVHSGSRTLNITNPVIGGNYWIELIQDATGGEGLLLGTGCTWKIFNGGAHAVTLTNGANALDVLSFTYDGTNCIGGLNGNAN